MKVRIGPYRGRCTVAPLEDVWYTVRYGNTHRWLCTEDDWNQDAWDRRFEKFTDWLQDAFNSTVNRILDARERKIQVKIHDYDTWSMDSTLSHIIVPMLEQLKATKHGSPFVDDADVPEHLKSTAAPPKENEWDVDELHEARWNWVLDEMIFAFKNIRDDSWEEQFHTGVHDILWIPVDKDGNEVPKEDAKLFQMEKGPNDTSKFDAEGHKAFSERITRGTILFGRYYRALWD